MTKIFFQYLLALLLTLQFSLSANANAAAAGKVIWEGAAEKISVTMSASPAAANALKPVESKALIYSVTNEAGEIINQFVYKKTSQQELAEFTPSKLDKYFRQLAESTKQLGRPQFYLKRFPLEVFKFFVALGALSVKDLVFNYNSNPMAVDQFLTGQKDPIGQAGFLAFMMTNHTVAEPLGAALSSRSLHVMLPYLGMSAGMMASNIVHELHYVDFNSMRECLRTIKDNKTACDKAFAEFIKRDAEVRIEEWSPAWMSMMLSTAGAWGAEMAIKKAAFGAVMSTRATGTLLLGINMLMLATPGGLWVKGLKLATDIVRFAGWIWLDAIMNVPVTYAFRSAIDVGPKLKKAHDDLEIFLDKKLKNNWADEIPAEETYCDYIQGTGCHTYVPNPYDFPELIERHSQYSKKWREANMIAPMTAHNNWAMYLTDLSQWYNATRQVYATLTSHVYENKYRFYKNDLDRSRSQDHILDRAYPLWGVQPKNFNLNPTLENPDSNWSNMFSLPDEVEKAQLQTIQENIKILKDRAECTLLSQHEKQIVDYFVNTWSLGDRKAIGRSLDYLNQILRIDRTSNAVEVSSVFKEVLTEVRNKLGNPHPMWLPLQGYVKYLESYFEKTAKFPTAPSGASFVEYLILQMLNGARPERGDKIVDKKRWSGFKAQFNPPALTDNVKYKSVLNKQVPEYLRNSLFAYDMFYEKDGVWVGGSNIPSTILKQLISENILTNQGKNNFSDWWKKTAEFEYISAWSDFENRYDQIIKDLYLDLTQVKDNARSGWLNASGSPQGVLASISYEINFYLSLLEKMNGNQGVEMDVKNLRQGIFAGITAIHKMLAKVTEPRSLALNGPEQIYERPEVTASVDETISYSKIPKYPEPPSVLMKTTDLSKAYLSSNIPSQEYTMIVEGIKLYVNTSFSNILQEPFGSNKLNLESTAAISAGVLQYLTDSKAPHHRIAADTNKILGKIIQAEVERKSNKKRATGLHKKSLEAIQAALVKTLSELETYALIINTANFEQNHDDKGNSKDLRCQHYKTLTPQQKSNPVTKEQYKDCL